MSRVAIIRTNAQNVLNDYVKLLELAEMEKVIGKDVEALIKLNLSWTLFFPACSTPPWQLHGVLNFMQQKGYDLQKIRLVENKTVVTDPWQGARLNKWLSVLQKFNLEFTSLPEVKWRTYPFKSKLLVLNKIFPDGIEIPEIYPGRSIIHLPTVKTHGHSITTGAIKNSFGGLLKEARHYMHKHIHEGLVDLMLMQKELHPAVFAVMDGTVAGDGAGPRTMIPRIKNVILASADSVAIDAVAAKLMGFDPWEIGYLRMCHEQGLGSAKLSEIEIVGLDITSENWHFQSKRSFVIYGDQLLRKGPLKFLEKPALHSPLWRWAPVASTLYHDYFWYPLIGQRRVKQFMQTEWGKLFQSY